MKKKALSLLLVLAMCLSMLPTAAFAAENTAEPQTQTEPAPVEQAAEPQNGGDSGGTDTIPAVPDDTGTPAEGGHTHYLCGGNTCTGVGGHTDSLTTFDNVLSMSDGKLMRNGNALDATTVTDKYGSMGTLTCYELEAGSYYLNSNLELDHALYIPSQSQDVKLCLNGHSITANGDFNAVIIYSDIVSSQPAVFTLTDCTDSGKITHGTKEDKTKYTGSGIFEYSYSQDHPTIFNMFGGTITGNETRQGGGGVRTSNNGYGGSFRMYGGTISGNKATATDTSGSNGGGVYIGCQYFQFTMYGGTISGNTASQASIGNDGGNGGGVYVGNGGTNAFQMLGGTISKNTAHAGGGVSVGASSTAGFTMTGGSITENSGTIGSGVYVGDTGTFNVSGAPKITGNNSILNLGNVYLTAGKTVTVTGALTEDASIGVRTARLPGTGDAVKVVTGSTDYTLTENDKARFSADQNNNQDQYDLLPFGDTLLLAPKGTDIESLHRHPVANGHPDEVWTPLTQDESGKLTIGGTALTPNINNQYQLPTGSYYLTGDITLSNNTNFSNQRDVKLDLNGHSIIISDNLNSKDNLEAIYIRSSTVFSLCDCSETQTGAITHGTKTDGTKYVGHGVSNQGTFNMYSGRITGNRAVGNGFLGCGGGVYNVGTFNMRGGSINDNEAQDGGGVYAYGTFTMTGGSISGNTATTNGGGVCVSTGNTVFNISGDVKITDNKKGDAANNVYLPYRKVITVTGSLSDAKIGVSTERNPADGQTVTVASVNKNDYTLTDADKNAFMSDGDYTPYLLDGSIILTSGGELHTHAVCGKANCTETGHSNTLWTPLTFRDGKLYYGSKEATRTTATGHIKETTADNKTSTQDEPYYVYTLPKGNYYLTSDIMLTGDGNIGGGKIIISGDVNLCLNGKSLSTSVKASDVTVVTVNPNCTLTLSDCLGGGKITSENKTFSGVQTGSGNTSGSAGMFTMYGGTITGTQYGVFTRRSFAMYGGEITGNDTGVEFANGNVTVGGSAKITGNSQNVYLLNNLILTIDPSLTADACIGVTTQAKPSKDNPVKFATGATKSLNYAEIFTPDDKNANYIVTKDDDGNLSLSAHTHSWQYKPSEDKRTITAICTADGCNLTDKSGGSVTINAPTGSLTYDGTAKAASLENELADGITAPEITYTKNGASLPAAPTDAGTYTASITMDGATASVEYTIEKATPEVKHWQGYPQGRLFNGKPIDNPTSLTIANGTFNDITRFDWYNAVKIAGGTYNKGTKRDSNPTDAGDYIIEAVFGETNNINAASSELGLTIGKAQHANNGNSINVPLNVYLASTEHMYEVDIVDALKDIPHGGSLEPNAEYGGISANLPSWVNSAVWDNGKLKVTMKALDKTAAGNLGSISVNLTSKNYTVVPVLVNITLQSKQEVSDIAITMTGWTYGDSANLPEYTVPSGVDAKITYAVKDSLDFSETVPSRAGDYTVKVTYETDTEIHTGTADFTIAPKALTNAMIAAITGERSYNGSAHTPDVIVTDGEYTLAKDTDYTLACSNNINASTADKQAVVTITGMGNYTGTASAKFVINPASLKIVSEDKMTAAAVYGTRAKDIKISTPEVYYLDADTQVVQVSGSWHFVGDGADDIPEVGSTKEYKAVFTPDSNAENYLALYTYITPEISKADGSVTAPTAEALTFNGEEQQLLLALPDSSTGTVLFSLDGTNYSTDIPTGRDAKTYTVWYKVAGDRNHLDVAPQSVTVTISKLRIPLPTLSKNVFTYNGETQTCEPVIDAAFKRFCTITGNEAKDVLPTGRYTATVKLTDPDNTEWDTDGHDTLDKTFEYEIQPAPVTVTALDKAITVGQSAPDLSRATRDEDYTITGLFGEDTLSVSLYYADPSDLSKAVTPDTGKAGTFAIVAGFGGTGSSNYAVTFVSGKLTITARSSGGGGGGGSSTPTYAVSAPAKTENGTVSISSKNAASGSTVTITVKPDSGYQLDRLTVTDKDGRELKLTDKGDGRYTFTMPAGKVEIKTAFAKEKETESEPETSPFRDVTASDYYYEAVKWAQEKGITGGMGGGLFGSDRPCTRAQIVTFLWRAAGSPEPKNAGSFTDVSADSYYAKAVAWAIENGITTGMSDGKFNPDAACTRAQSVTFLFRASGASASGTPDFSDVAADAYYAEAVKWAMDHGITNGMGNGLFGSDSNCTRAQIVVFLFRTYGK